MDLTERKVGSELIFNGKIINLRRDTVTLPDGKQASREVVEHNGGVCVVALTDKEELYLVKQYRYPIGEILPEIPAGKIGKNEDPRDCGIRELKEETGCTAKEFIYLGKIYPSPGYSAENIYIYLARGLDEGENCLDEDEFLQVEKIPADKVVKMIETGEIHDGKTVAGVFLMQRFLLNEKGKA